jgi:orotate phosphoribosyltransferase
MSYDRDALLELIRTESLQQGEFTLASGKKASYYLDCRQHHVTSQGCQRDCRGHVGRDAFDRHFT